MIKGFKSGFVSIIGRPNVGKSTLINNLLDFNVSIITPKAQTTRDNISGIYTDDNSQIIFIDTPGIHKAFNELGNVMNDFAYSSLDGVDLILYMDDCTHQFDDIDKDILDVLSKVKIPIIILINKVDLLSKLNHDAYLDEINKHHIFYESLNPVKVMEISAVDNLTKIRIIDEIKNHLSFGPMYYPEDQIMDKDERFLVKEIVREKILLFTKKEVPYSVAVEVESFKEDEKDPNLLNISCVIVTERPTQKMIIIGQGGKMIKKIGHEARIDLQKLFDKKIYLELFVKVEEDWRNRKYYLKQFGYKKEQ